MNNGFPKYKFTSAYIRLYKEGEDSVVDSCELNPERTHMPCVLHSQIAQTVHAFLYVSTFIQILKV